MNRHPLAVLSGLVVISGLLALLAFVPAASAQHVEDCSDTLMWPQFVWGIPDGDPDGGLGKHAGPGAHTEQLGVLTSQQAPISPAGRCRVASDGSTWVEIWDHPGSSMAWVNGHFLVPAENACLLRTQRSDDGLILHAGGGHAFIDTGRDRVAFQPSWHDSYHFVDREVIATDALCEVRHWHQAPGPVSIGGHTVRGIDAPQIWITICG